MSVRADVIAPPTDAEGGLYSEINDNSVHDNSVAICRRKG